MQKKRIYIYTLIVLTFSCLITKNLYSQNKNNAEFERAKTDLPIYYNFIKHLKAEGYKFWDFKTYWNADKTKLPDKLIVIRHDVHQRDIAYAFDTYIIEKNLLGDNVATYFVMLGFPDEEKIPDFQKEYLGIIKFLKDRKVDVQPHISANDLYHKKVTTWWKNKSKEELRKLANENYIVDYKDNCVKVSVKTDGTDVFDLNEMNDSIIQCLKEYNKMWKLKTGLTAKYYASHGSKLPFNNTIFNNSLILDQEELLNSKVYAFDTYNTQLCNYLVYLSDNSGPDWIENPDTILPGRYQFLSHPYVWKNPGVVRNGRPPVYPQKK